VTVVTLRILRDDGPPDPDLGYEIASELDEGDQFLLDDVWYEVVKLIEESTEQIHVVRRALPIGGFSVGGRYPAELCRDEARALFDYVRRQQQSEDTRERRELARALAAVLAGDDAPELDIETLGELAWTIRGLQTGERPRMPGIEGLRAQIQLYLGDIAPSGPPA
jgi:hypothetical protein